MKHSHWARISDSLASGSKGLRNFRNLNSLLGLPRMRLVRYSEKNEDFKIQIDFSWNISPATMSLNKFLNICHLRVLVSSSVKQIFYLRDNQRCILIIEDVV